MMSGKPQFLKLLSQLHHEGVKEQNATKQVERLTTDVDSAWEVISPAGKPQLTWTQTVESLRFFEPAMQLQEAKLLCGSGTASPDKLRHLLCKLPLPKDCDAELEAMQLLKVPNIGGVLGSLPIATLLDLLVRLPGVGELDAEDMVLLNGLVDTDKDGVIGLEDFRLVGKYAPPRQPQTAALKKKIEALAKAEKAEKGPAAVHGAGHA